MNKFMLLDNFYVLLLMFIYLQCFFYKLSINKYRRKKSITKKVIFKKAKETFFTNLQIVVEKIIKHKKKNGIIIEIH